MKKSFFKKLAIWALALSMVFATNGVLVLANSMTNISKEETSIDEDIINIEYDEMDSLINDKVEDNLNADEEKIENEDSQVEENEQDVFGVDRDYTLFCNFLDDKEIQKEDVKKIIISKGKKNITSDVSFELDKNNLKGLKGYFDKTTGILTINTNNEDDNIVVNEGYQLFYDFPNVEEITGLSNLDTHNCKSMAYMFALDKKLTKVDFENLDISSLTETISMFEKCESLKEIDLSNFHNDKKIQMDLMFLDTGFETVDLSGVQLFSTYYMYGNCKNLREVSLKDADTTNWKYTSLMFSGCDELKKVDMTGCDFSKLLDCFYFGAFFDENSRRVMTKVIDEINVSNCTFAKDSSEFFAGTVSFAQLNPFDGQGTLIKEYKGVRYKKIICNNAKGIENASSMFANNDELTYLDVSDWDTSNLSNAKDMLSNIDNLNKIIISEELSKKILDLGLTGTWENVDTNEIFDFSKETPNQTGNATYVITTKTGDTLDETSELPSKYIIQNNILDNTSIDKSDVRILTFEKGSKDNHTNLTKYNINEKGLDVFFDNNNKQLIISCKENDNMELLSINTFFAMFKNVEEINGLGNIDTKKEISMARSFADLKKLKKLDFENLNTDNLSYATFMFSNCESLQEINFSNFNKNHKNIEMTQMFYNTGLKKVVLYGLENCTALDATFAECKELTEVDFSNTDTKNITKATGTFKACDNIEKITLNETISKELLKSGLQNYWKNLSNDEVVDILSKDFKQKGTAKYIKATSEEYEAYLKEKEKTQNETTVEESTAKETTIEETTTVAPTTVEETTIQESTTIAPTTAETQVAVKETQPTSGKGGSGGSGGGGGGGSAAPKIENAETVANKPQTNPNAETKVQKSLVTTPITSNTKNSTWTKDSTGNWNLEVVNANGQKQKATNTWACFRNDLVVNGQVISVTDFYYFDDKGKMITGWLSDNTGVKYYLDTEEKNLGKMCRGWKQIGTDYYYLGNDGKLLTNTVTQDGYIVDATGKRSK